MIRCTISPRIRLEVCAPHRVAPPAVEGAALLEGASSVSVEAVCVRGGAVVCVGGSTVEARGFAVRGGRAGIVSGSAVTASAKVRHNMEEIKRIFGESSIEILLAGDGAGGLIDYVPPPWSQRVDTTDTTEVPPLTPSFSTPATQVGTVGNIEFYGGPLVTDFSLGIFSQGLPDTTSPIAQINNTIAYSATRGRIMIQDGAAGTNNYSPDGFADLEGPDFLVWSADSASQTMEMHASGGRHGVGSYPSSMTVDLARMVHQGSSGVDYKAQFYVLLNRLMTDTEIAQVRALL